MSNLTQHGRERRPVEGGRKSKLHPDCYYGALVEEEDDPMIKKLEEVPDAVERVYGARIPYHPDDPRRKRVDEISEEEKSRIKELMKGVPGGAGVPSLEETLARRRAKEEKAFDDSNKK